MMFHCSFQMPLCLVLYLGWFTHTCHGQFSTGTPAEGALTPKPAPVIVGTPPPVIPQAGLETDSFLVSQYIRSIFQDSKGNYWFGPAGYSVSRYDIKTLTYFSNADFFQGNPCASSSYGNSVHAISEDKNGHIWFGTDCGAVRFDGSTFWNYTEKNGLRHLGVGRKCILTDKAGTTWVGTGGGVFLYNPSADSTEGQCFSPFDLLPPIPIKDIMEDKAGHIWFATQEDGVFLYDGEKIMHLTGREGLGDNYAGGILQDESGNMWFTMKGGICRYDGVSFTDFTTHDGLGGSEVWGICLEKPNIIWITARGSTTRFDPSLLSTHTSAFTVYTIHDGINCCVQSMYQDRSGNMWWGAGAGLYRFDGRRFYQVKQQGPW